MNRDVCHTDKDPVHTDFSDHTRLVGPVRSSEESTKDLFLTESDVDTETGKEPYDFQLWRSLTRDLFLVN